MHKSYYETDVKKVLLFIYIVSFAIIAFAKDYVITLQSNPENAQVYLNNVLVATSTPAVINVPQKVATKVMLFKFVKEGYENKNMTVQYTKDQLKYGPVVLCEMKKTVTQNSLPAKDPTVSNNQASQRVDRQHGGATDMEASIIRWFFDSDPRGSRIMYRVISSVPNEVKNTNETYLTTTPYEETKGFNIPGLTYQNSRNVTIEVKISKRGYEDQVKRYNVRQVLDQQEISGFFELVPKDNKELQDSKE